MFLSLAVCLIWWIADTIIKWCMLSLFLWLLYLLATDSSLQCVVINYILLISAAVEIACACARMANNPQFSGGGRVTIKKSSSTSVFFLYHNLKSLSRWLIFVCLPVPYCNNTYITREINNSNCLKNVSWLWFWSTLEVIFK